MSFVYKNLCEYNNFNISSVIKYKSIEVNLEQYKYVCKSDQEFFFIFLSQFIFRFLFKVRVN